ncbi:helix-turn-helix domain-containing protein [Saccharibacillus sp. CPCC 101409]|uniref:helix-turn-helix domain-containing protein n=1 Tax=Saccharibacillus sp. CPCC 101409 TaxID=3058041 RepID=UPI002673C67F|nr:helix-turn-helix domain-containing protein [Saccharibacillus sp. CPCC 101409]MDO3412459.1 helix-turn-helix domain-containing protein [Saccharibacillus sp. CPCC 101409]
MNKLMDSLRVNKLFVKILLSFLSFLLPLVLLGALTYTNFVTDRKAEYTQKLNLDLTASARKLEDYWRQIYETSTVFFGDPSVTRLMKPKQEWGAQELTNIQALQGSMSRAKFNVNSFVDHFFVYVDDEYVFTDDGINDYDYFFNKFYHYRDYDTQFWSERLNTVRYMEVLKPALVETSFESKEVVTFLTANRSGTYTPVLGVTVAVDKIWEAFAPIVKPGINRVVAADKDGEIVMSSDADFNNEAAFRAIGSDLPDGENAPLEVTVDGEDFIADAVYNDTIGWYFYAFTPVEEFNRQASGIYHFIVTLCIVLCLVSLIFAFLFSYRLYTPIRRIGEVLERTVGEVKDEAGTRYSRDLRHIGAGIQRMMFNQSRFQGQMEVLAQEYVDYVLFQLMKGHSLSEDQRENLQRILQTRLGFEQDRFLCCAISLKFKDRFWTDIQDVDRILIEVKMKNLFYGLLKENADLYVLETGKSQYALVFNMQPDADRESIRGRMEELAGIFSSDTQYCRLHIAIGDICEGIEGIAKSYRNSMYALHRITGKPDFKIVEFTGKEGGQEQIVYTYADENRLLQLLRFGNAKEVAQWVGQLLQNSRHASYSLDALVTKLFETGRRFLVERGLDPEEILSGEDRRDLLQTQRTIDGEDRRQTILLNFFFGAMDRIKQEHSSPRSAELASTIKQYVEANYRSDLHLEKIAEEMGVTVKYVSRLFKETYDLNITGFISRLRIDKAKELLETTNLPVIDVATSVGIFDRTTFLRTFKKFEGVSPNEYRKQIHNRKEENHASYHS